MNFQDLEILRHTWGHTAKSQGERDGTGLGFCFLGGRGWGPGLLRAPSLLVNLKHKSRNVKLGDEENQGAQMISFRN